MRLSFKLLAVTLSVADAQAAGTDTGVLDAGQSAAGGDRRLQPGQPLPVAEVCPEGFVSCVNGYVEDSGGMPCSEACGGACCQGTQACEAFTGLVCRDGTSCQGDASCRGGYIGSVDNGCGEKFACAFINAVSVVGSCNGYGSCAGLGMNSDAPASALSNCCNEEFECAEQNEPPETCAGDVDLEPPPAPTPPSNPFLASWLVKSGDCTTPPTTASECEAAAALLGIQYQTTPVSKKRMPGGCFGKTNNEKGKDVKVRWNDVPTKGTNCGFDTQDGKFTLSCVCVERAPDDSDYATTSEPSSAPTSSACVPYSADACREAATKAGLELGGNGFAFEGAYSTKGCYSYRSGTYAGIAYYGTGAGDNQGALDGNMYRPEGFDCEYRRVF